MKKNFDFENIKDFDNHIELSIPNYKGLSSIFSVLVTEFTPPKGICIDIGCSTGRFLSNVDKINAKYIGVDSVNMAKVSNGYDFVQSDLVDYLIKLDHADVIVSMFTLQFLGEHERKKAVKELIRLRAGGATLLIAEKVFILNARINHTLHREHIKYKRKGFSDKNILDKDYELLGSMFCKTHKQMTQELSNFSGVNQVWQSFNFMGWCITNE